MSTTFRARSRWRGDARPSGEAASPGASSSAGPWDRTYHVRQTQGDCTFDFDAPEELKAVKGGVCSGPTCVTLESATFQFVGFEGTTLDREPKHPLDMFKGEYKDVFRGTENGVNLAIVTRPDAKAGEKYAVTGSGGEPYKSERTLGCTFSCDGPRDRMEDVVKICKSVRISVKPSPK